MSSSILVSRDTSSRPAASKQRAGLSGLSDGQKITCEVQKERGREAAVNLKAYKVPALRDRWWGGEGAAFSLSEARNGICLVARFNGGRNLRLCLAVDSQQR